MLEYHRARKVMLKGNILQDCKSNINTRMKRGGRRLRTPSENAVKDHNTTLNKRITHKMTFGFIPYHELL